MRVDAREGSSGGALGQAAGWRLDGVSASGFACFSPESRARSSGGRPENGTARANISSVHSGFSSSINSGSGTTTAGFLSFGAFIFVSLLPISPSQTDDPDCAVSNSEHQRMKCFSDEPKGESANLAVILARVLIEGRRIEIKFRGSVKADPAQAKIPFAFLRVERNLHLVIVTGNRSLDIYEIGGYAPPPRYEIRPGAPGQGPIDKSENWAARPMTLHGCILT